MFRRPGDGFWAGIVVGVLIVAAMMHWDVKVADNSQATKAQSTVVPVAVTRAATRDFISAWTRMVNGAWLVESNHTRTLKNGQTATFTVRDIQSPPDYLDVSATETNGSVGGRLYVCASDNQGSVTGCRDNGPAVPFEALAQRKLSAVQNAVLGADATYDVADVGAGCYRVFVKAGKTTNVWGNSTKFCFDAATGAPVLTRIETDEGLAETTAIKVVEPSPADFQVPGIPATGGIATS